jgi:hypothetical protein
MAVVRYRPNKAGLDFVLRDAKGPVQLHVANKGREVEGFARQRVGVKTGELKRSIGSRVVRSHKGGYSTEVFASAPYALFHHSGTRPHIIRPRNASVLRFEVGGSVVFAKRVWHPGFRGNRFLWLAMVDAGLQPKRR